MIGNPPPAIQRGATVAKLIRCRKLCLEQASDVDEPIEEREKAMKGHGYLNRIINRVLRSQ
jgi:hypothetical protein